RRSGPRVSIGAQAGAVPKADSATCKVNGSSVVDYDHFATSISLSWTDANSVEIPGTGFSTSVKGGGKFPTPTPTGAAVFDVTGRNGSQLVLFRPVPCV